MTSVVMPAGSYGVDAASFAKVTDFSPVRAAGADWVSFYIGGNFGVGKRQIEAAWAAGLPVMPNFERSANAALGGYSTGVTHAITAQDQLTALGFRAECPVIFSGVDFSPSSSQFPALDGYHLALVDRLEPDGWVGGAYGPRNYLQHLADADWWPDDWPLWHWGGDGFTVYPFAWCKQWYGYDRTPIDASALTYAIDENTLLKPMKFWIGYGDDAPLDPTEDPDMTDAEITAIANKVWQVALHNYPANQEQAAVFLMGFAHSEAYGANQKADQILAKLSAAAPSNCATPAQVEEIVRRVLREVELTIDFNLPGG